MVSIAKGYKIRAGDDIAIRFSNRVRHSIKFVVENPYACATYIVVRGKSVRSWGVKGFPVSVFSRYRSLARLCWKASTHTEWTS